MTRRFLLGIVLVATTIGPAFAEATWSLSANDSTYSYVCGGDDSIVITGNGNSLTITGQCAVVDINGSRNKIAMETIGSIKVTGNNNDVRYTRAPDGKAKPVIKNTGAANTIRRISPRTAEPTQ